MKPETFGESDGEVVQVTSVELLAAVLDAHAVTWAAWGADGTKKIEHLYQEIREGDSVLRKQAGQLRRYVRAVYVYVYCVLDGKEHVLRETKTVFDDGRIRRRRRPASIAEKMHAGEEPERAAIRALHEELGVRSLVALVLLGTEEETSDSQSYPSLQAVTRRWVFSVTLPEGQALPGGYLESSGGKTTYFAWVPASPTLPGRPAG